VARETLEIPAAWTGADLSRDESLRRRSSEAEVEEIEAERASARAPNKPRAELTREDFPLETLVDEIASWREALESGRGFQLVSGLPVERWDASEVETVYWCLGQHLGVPGAQNPAGDLVGTCAAREKTRRTHSSVCIELGATSSVGETSCVFSKSDNTKYDNQLGMA
jgi:hypothetical protein